LLEILSKLLANSRAAGNFLHNLFSAIHRRARLRQAYAAFIFVVLLPISYFLFPPAPLQVASLGIRPAFAMLIPVVLRGTLLALGLYTIPLLLISHWERRCQQLLVGVMGNLNVIAHEIMATASSVEFFDDPSLAMDKLINSCNQAGKNCIITPTAFFLRADEWIDRLRKPLAARPELLVTIEKMADKAPQFRAALEHQFSGNLRMILPDPKDPVVRQFYRARAHELGFSNEELLLEVVADAVKWAKGELRNKRNAHKKNRPDMTTSLHLTNRSPTFRFMLVNDLCFIQAFPTQGGFGISQNIALLRRAQNPVAFAGIECGLDSISSMF
jgi:hypothetical protein